MTNYSCYLLRPHAPPFQKIKWNPWNLVITLQKSCFLGPTIFEIPQPNWFSIIEYRSNILVTLELYSPLIHTVSLQDFCSFFRFFSLLADENRGFFMWNCSIHLTIFYQHHFWKAQFSHRSRANAGEVSTDSNFLAKTLCK